MTDQPDPDRDPENGQFLPGNSQSFAVQAMRRFQQPRAFETADDLIEACVEYFQWVEEHPLAENKAMNVDGAVIDHPMAKMRAMSIKALCNHIGVTQRSWEIWRKSRPDLAPAIEMVDQIIHTQKFEGAAAGLLNPTIIMRDLGLRDEHAHVGADGGPMVTANLDMTPKERARVLAFILREAVENGTEEPQTDD